MVENVKNSFQWSSNFSVNVAELDDDHQVVFELLNHLDEAIEKGAASELPLIIDDIQQYMIYHFRHEEDMMQACHYPYLDNHKRVHRMMESKLEEFTKNLDNRENLEAARWLVGFFKNWLEDHVIGMDKNYSDCIQTSEGGRNHA